MLQGEVASVHHKHCPESEVMCVCNCNKTDTIHVFHIIETKNCKCLSDILQISINECIFRAVMVSLTFNI